jgi:NAD(P)-dependent dehydrogenase (short-subunit alcohol dehydrogenase family)
MSPTSSLMGRRAVVTGSARGIGLAVARRLLREGVRVLLADIDEGALLAVARELQNEGLDAFVACKCNIADPDDVQSLADSVKAGLDGLDILVNNAAILDWTPLESLTAARAEEVWRVNFMGSLNCIQTLLPELQRSSSGCIVNVASINGLRGTANSVAYNSAKAALVNATRCLAVDLGSRGIIVNAVAPGFVDTRMSRLPDGTSEYDTEWFRDVYIKHRRIPLGRPGQVDDIAGPVAFLCSNDARYMTGQVLVVDGGVTATF